MNHTTPEMNKCIDECLNCHRTCLRTSMSHCLEMGGTHVQPEHFRLMLNCAEICQTAANFMLSASPMHGAVCAACAEVCAACEKSCEDVGDMQECVQACHACAASCRQMGKQPPSKSARSKSARR